MNFFDFLYCIRNPSSFPMTITQMPRAILVKCTSGTLENNVEQSLVRQKRNSFAVAFKDNISLWYGTYYGLNFYSFKN